MCDYIAYVNDRTWKHTDSLFEALAWLSDFEGRREVYERLGMDVARKIAEKLAAEDREEASILAEKDAEIERLKAELEHERSIPRDPRTGVRWKEESSDE